jgi:hypothetical protein
VQDTNGCIVVKGQTSILLDNDSSLIRTKAYEAIENGLVDPEFLEGYTDSVVRTAFLSRGKAVLVEAGQSVDQSGDESTHISPITATIAAAAASVSFVVASVFCYGFMRRDGRNHPEPSVRHKGRSLKTGARTVVSDSLGGRARRHFVRLEDLSASPASYMTASLSPMSPDYEYKYDEEELQAYEDNYNPTIAWSVSDITSDSASLRSGVSRTPSMLERIEEEEDEDREKESDNEDHQDVKPEKNATKKKFRSGTSRSPNSQKVEDYDCKSLGRDQMSDVSDLDPCFTIVPVPDDAKSDASDNISEKGDSFVADKDVPDCDPCSKEVPLDGTADVLESSESDFSGSSLLVQADPTEEDAPEFDQNLSQPLIRACEADENTLEYSCSTSDMVDLVNVEAKEVNANREVDHIPVVKTESEQKDDTEQMTDCNVEEMVNHTDFNAAVDADNNQNTFAQLDPNPSAASPSEDVQVATTNEANGNVEDSIEEWVSELLDQPSNES